MAPFPPAPDGAGSPASRNGSAGLPSIDLALRATLGADELDRLALALARCPAFVEAVALRVAALADPEPAGNTSPYLRVAEAARVLGRPESFLYDWRSQGRFTNLRDGSGGALVLRSELEAYLAGSPNPRRTVAEAAAR